MLKYCEYCGQEMDENATHCPLCSEKNTVTALPALTESAYQNADAFYTEDKSNQKRTRLLIIIGTLLAAAVLTLTLFRIFTPQPQDPVKLAVTIATKDKFDKLEDFYPEIYWTYLKEELDMTAEDEIKACSDEYHQAYQRFYSETYGDNFKVTYRITNKEEIGQRVLGKLQNEFEKRYSLPKKDLNEGKKLTIEFTIAGNKGEHSVSGDFYVIKLDSKWYGVDENGFLAPDFVYDTLLSSDLEEAYYVIYDEIMYAEG